MTVVLQHKQFHYGTVLLSTILLHHYEREAIVARHVASKGSAEKSARILGSVVFSVICV